jgi:hypothetical protein
MKQKRKWRMEPMIGRMLETHAGFFHAHDDMEPGSVTTDAGREYRKHAAGIYADGAVWEYTGSAPESSDPAPTAVDQPQENSLTAALKETEENK